MDIASIFQSVIGENCKKVNEERFQVEKFIISLRTSSTCRYVASSRLNKRDKMQFRFIIAFSLGLIFIPLMQCTGVTITFPGHSLDTIQIFLAITVLVYSAINFKSRYAARAEKLNECGDKIKRLALELEVDIKKEKDISSYNYRDYIDRYYYINSSAEDHSQTDYLKAKLQLSNYYSITGCRRVIIKIRNCTKSSLKYLISCLILFIEIVIIIDMLSAWDGIGRILQ